MRQADFDRRGRLTGTPLAAVLACLNHIHTLQDVFRIWSDRRYVEMVGRVAESARKRRATGKEASNMLTTSGSRQVPHDAFPSGRTSSPATS